MPDIIPFPFLNLEQKQDSAAKLAAVNGLPTKEHLFAPEINLIVERINQLKQLLDAMYTTAEADANNQIIDLGEIGNLPIHQVVRNLDPARSIQADYLRIFRATRNNIEDNYLYTGPGGLLGIDQVQAEPNEFYAISGNFLANGGEILVVDPTQEPNEVLTVLQVALNNLYNAIAGGAAPTLQAVLDAGNTAINSIISLKQFAGYNTGRSASLSLYGVSIGLNPGHFVNVRHDYIQFSRDGKSLYIVAQHHGPNVSLLTPIKPSGEYTLATLDDIAAVGNEVWKNKNFTENVVNNTSPAFRKGAVHIVAQSTLFATSTEAEVNDGASIGHTQGGGGTTGFVQMMGAGSNSGVPNAIIGGGFHGQTSIPAMSMCAVSTINYAKYGGAGQVLFRFANGYLTDRENILDIKRDAVQLYKYPSSRADAIASINYLSTDKDGNILSKPITELTKDCLRTIYVLRNPISVPTPVADVPFIVATIPLISSAIGTGNIQLRIEGALSKEGVSGAGYDMYISTSSTALVGGGKIATLATSGSGVGYGIKRTFSLIMPNIIEGYKFTIPNLTDIVAYGGSSIEQQPWAERTSNNYIHIVATSGATTPIITVKQLSAVTL